MEDTPNLNTISDVVFFTNRALQGEVRENMRKISVAYDDMTKKFTLYIYFDKPLSQAELDYDVPSTILAEISSNFPNAIDIDWEDKIHIIPYPNKLPNVGISVYRRYEPSPEE